MSLGDREWRNGGKREGGSGKSDYEPGSATRRVFDPRLSTVLGDDIVDDGQADTAARNRTSGDAARERAPDQLALRFVDARGFVADRDSDVVRNRLDLDAHRLPGGSVFDGVIEQVDDDALERVGPELHRRRVVGFEEDLGASRGGEWTELGDDLG